MTRLRCRALVASVAFAGALSLAAQDLTIISKTTMGGRAGTSTQYLSSTQTRTTDGQNDAIIEFKTGRLVFVDHKKKEYSETSMEEMAAYFDSLQRDLKGNPMYESMFGGPDDVKVEKLKTSRKVAGYDHHTHVRNISHIEDDLSEQFNLRQAREVPPLAPLALFRITSWEPRSEPRLVVRSRTQAATGHGHSHSHAHAH